MTVFWRKWLVSVTVVLSGSGIVAPPAATAEEAVLIPGATVFKHINPTYPIIAEGYPRIGVHFHTDDDPQVVDYSQNPLATDTALVEGVGKANLAVRAIHDKVVVIGESMGSMVASRLAAELASSSEPPEPDAIRFVLLAPPEEGVAHYFAVGSYIPVLNYRVSRTPKSRYPTSIVIGEYDGWADPPDRPWNLLASANAVLGVNYVHGPPMWRVDPTSVPPENITVDGNVTTYSVPTKNLPLTQPLRDLGVPDSAVDRADQILRPIIDAGYVRHDKPGDTRPYLADGTIRRNPAAERPVSLAGRTGQGAHNQRPAASATRRGQRGE